HVRCNLSAANDFDRSDADQCPRAGADRPCDGQRGNQPRRRINDFSRGLAYRLRVANLRHQLCRTAMRHTLPLTPQFYVTAPQPCPYLEGRMERKLFTALQGEFAETLNDALSQQGFRRSQNVLYRPSCAECSACLSARVRVAEFKPSRTQSKILRRNANLRREASSPWATEDQFALFRRYLDSRHAQGGMADMDIFEF